MDQLFEIFIERISFPTLQDLLLCRKSKGLKVKQEKQGGKVGEQHLQLTQNLKIAENKTLSIKRLFKTCIYSRANWNAELTNTI
jgi:hypothetical protein